jgi:putative hydrolase of the HAD superfamily
MKPKAVVFDLFGTLTIDTSRSHWRAGIGRVADALGARPEDLVQLFHQTFNDRATGMLGDTISILRMFCERLAITPTAAHLEEALHIRLTYEEEMLQPREGALSLLRLLRRSGYRTAVLSDSSPELALLWPHHSFAKLLDATVFSFEVGFKKPHPAVYTIVCKRLDISPGECLYVGDGGSHELTGARAAGMRAIMLGSSRTYAGNHLLRYDEDILWDGPCIESLLDIWSILDPKHAAVDPVDSQYSNIAAEFLPAH